MLQQFPRKSRKPLSRVHVEALRAKAAVNLQAARLDLTAGGTVKKKRVKKELGVQRPLPLPMEVAVIFVLVVRAT